MVRDWIIACYKLLQVCVVHKLSKLEIHFGFAVHNRFLRVLLHTEKVRRLLNVDLGILNVKRSRG